MNNYQAQLTFQEAVSLYQQGIPLPSIQAQTGWTLENGAWTYTGYGQNSQQTQQIQTESQGKQGGFDWNILGKTGYNVYNAPEGQSLFGRDGSLGGGWMAGLTGALAGYNQGKKNYEEDPNMWSGADGYGKYHKDYRAELGGGTLGGVMGYWGGPLGAAAAGPTVDFIHPYAEKTTRNVINFGDKLGGAWGGVSFDPAGALASGKYSWGEAAKGMALGPLDKLFK